MGRMYRLARRVVHATRGTRWHLVAGLGGVVFLVAALLAVIVFMPSWARYPSGLTSDQLATHMDNLRGQILQGLGGLALLGTLYFSARTLRLNRRGQVTERFTKAIEQLASEKLEVRLGGIYALEQIAVDSEELHWPVMEVLTAFLRENSATNESREIIDALESSRRGQALARPPVKAGSRQPRLAADLQAIATVLGRRPENRRRHEAWSGRRLDLSGVWLPTAQLKGAQLQRSDLTDARLDRASLAGANLQGADLMDAHLYGADLKNAHLEDANFISADLEQAELGSRSQFALDGESGAHLAGATFMFATLAGPAFAGPTSTATRSLRPSSTSRRSCPRHWT